MVDELDAVNASATISATRPDLGRRDLDADRGVRELASGASNCGMSRAPMLPKSAGAPTDQVERAVAANEERIAIELVDTVIRDLFGVGLTLQGALQHVAGPGERPLTAAIDEIDRIIRTIRNVVFALR
jgi:signal transduction histidine kinase